MNDKLKGMVYGLAVGDALGVPYEFCDRDTFTCAGMTGGGTWRQPAGTWSDDTSMTLATMDSIADCDGVDIDDMREKFRAWAHGDAYTCNGETFDIGNTTREALRLGRGLDDEYSNGNGSLMRILPLAFVPNVTVEQVEAVSAITHAHRYSRACCWELVTDAIRLIDGEAPAHSDLQRDEIRSGGYVGDTLTAARWCVGTASSYAEAVLLAVNLGGDTDTTAAVAGGLAGIVWGYDAIPEAWLAALRNKDEIERVLSRWPF